jgi:hypothetical protein
MSPKWSAVIRAISKIERNSSRCQGDRTTLVNAVDDPQKENDYYANVFIETTEHMQIFHKT